MTVIQRTDFVFCVINAVHLLEPAHIALHVASNAITDVEAQIVKASRVLNIVNNHLPSQVRHAPHHCGNTTRATIGNAF